MRANADISSKQGLFLVIHAFLAACGSWDSSSHFQKAKSLHNFSSCNMQLAYVHKLFQPHL